MNIFFRFFSDLIGLIDLNQWPTTNLIGDIGCFVLGCL